jgi:hypothetical protein
MKRIILISVLLASILIGQKTKCQNNGTGCPPSTGGTSILQLNLVANFGADPTGIANSHDAFTRASTCINGRGGNCKLIIPSGNYKIGKQVHKMGTKGSNGYPINFDGIDAISLNGVSNVTIEGGLDNLGNQPSITFESGLKFGTFNYNGTIPSNPDLLNIHPMGNYDSLASYLAEIGNFMLLKNCSNIKIKFLTVDGNIYNAMLGGNWGAQLADDEPANTIRHIESNHTGIRVNNSNDIEIISVAFNYFGLDGLYIDNSIEKKNVLVSGSLFTGNCRQGFSWVGGDGLAVLNSTFRRTGEAINYNSSIKIINSPGAGIDIEPSGGKQCINGNFSGVQCYENLNSNLAITGDKSQYSKNLNFNYCIFYDRLTTDFRKDPNVILAKSVLNIKFTNCKFYGTVDCESNYGDCNNNVFPTPSNKLLFDNCYFSDCHNGSLIKPWINALFQCYGFKYTEIRNSNFVSFNAGLIISRGNLCTINGDQLDDCRLKLIGNTFKCNKTTVFSDALINGWASAASNSSTNNVNIKDAYLQNNTFTHRSGLVTSFLLNTLQENNIGSGYNQILIDASTSIPVCEPTIVLKFNNYRNSITKNHQSK